MSFVLAVDKRGGVRKDLDQIIVVELVYLLVVSEGAVENIHHYAGVVHHAQGIYG